MNEVWKQNSLNKVPEVTLGFWIIKIAATTLGETGGDSVTMTLNWEGLLFSDGRSEIRSFSKELLVVQEFAWNPNGCGASFRSHFNDPVAHIDALQIH
jgi:hypothetical protein